MQKKFRDSGGFEALMKACHANVDSLDAPIVAGISAADKDVFLKDKAFEQHGYTYLGGDFIRSEQGGRQKENTDTNLSTSIVG